MKELVQLLKNKHMTISSIESLTGGMFASTLSEVAGASSVFKGSLVSYQTIIKEQVLGIDKTLIERYGVISKECAEAMAKAGKKMFQSDVVVSCTGNAGPDVMDDKPVGLVFMSVAIYGKIETYQKIFKGTRNEVRKNVCEYLQQKVLEQII